jgi:hypothetical protein
MAFEIRTENPDLWPEEMIRRVRYIRRLTQMNADFTEERLSRLTSTETPSFSKRLSYEGSASTYARSRQTILHQSDW